MLITCKPGYRSEVGVVEVRDGPFNIFLPALDPGRSTLATRPLPRWP